MSWHDCDRQREWLNGLTAGSEVLVSGSGWETVGLITKVDRVTTTQIVVGPSRFRRSDGYAVGSSGYHRSSISEVTDTDRLAIRRAKVLRLLRETDWKALPDETLHACAAIVLQHRPKEEAS